MKNGPFSLLVVVLLFASVLLSCSLFGAKGKFLSDNDDLRTALDAYQKQKGGTLVEIEIFPGEITFNTGTSKYAYKRGFVVPEAFDTPSSRMDFQIDRIDDLIAGIDNAKKAALPWAGKNSYLKSPVVTKIVVRKDSINRDDNLVSNVGKSREAVLLDVYMTSADVTAVYTVNMSGNVVDVPVTNIKPRTQYMNETQMKKSFGEIKPMFGGKLKVYDLTIQTENFSFTAADPKNPDEMNSYRYDTQEFLMANPSIGKSVAIVEQEIRSRAARVPFVASSVFFDIDEVDFSMIPKFEQKTLETAKLSRGRVAKFTINKMESGDGKINRLTWRVEAYGDRSEKATVEFDARGEVIEVKSGG